MGNILIIDDEPRTGSMLASHLRQDQHSVALSCGIADTRNQLARDRFDALIADQAMLDGHGFDVLTFAHKLDPTVSVVLLAASASVELAVECMRRGAFDLITKPIQPAFVRDLARRACERTASLRENRFVRPQPVPGQGCPEILGKSRAVAAIRDQIGRFAPSSGTVLITGETGTGKELVARAIHKSSPRAANPFVPINCAAIAETLLDTELFGHERGAFTDADRARAGLFEAAHEGTLFLDEVGELSAAAQAKLLRVLTDGEVLRVGSTKSKYFNVRVVAATHRDLFQRVREGRFREDLFYRLAVLPIAVPPLRERPEDIPDLSAMFCVQAAQQLPGSVRKVGGEAIAKLQAYEFPGNIRELRNLIERAVILANGPEIMPWDFLLPGPVSAPSIRGAAKPRWLHVEHLPDTLNLRATVEELERDLIQRALAASGGVQAEAARRLLVSRSDLAYKISKLGITPSGLGSS